jgi:integrase
MAFTGCRLGEAAQLCKHDIRLEKGIWVIDINEIEDDKSLKTTGSKRLVPMHLRLIELGLPELASSSPNGFLWPQEMRNNPNPKASKVDKLQKRLAYVLRSSGIDDTKKTASHSFRHTVSSRLKALSVHEYQIAEILGHELDNISTGRYGSVTDLTTLKSVIDRLVLPV